HVPSIVRVGPARKRDGRAGGPASVSFCSAGAYGAVFRVTISRFFGVLPIGLSVDAVDGRQVLSRKELYMYRMFGIVMLAALASQDQAKVDPVQAARVGADLTPLGAERAGNAAGTIPAWTGGVTPPAGYQPGMHHPDPYADDAMLYRVDGADLSQHRELLPAGLADLLERHPDYYLQVYPTRRSAANPQRIYEATRANAERAELISKGNGGSGAVAGIPFPIPQDGMEVIWNHILHYKGDQTHFINNQAVVINGKSNLIKRDRYVYYIYNREGMTIEDMDNTLLYYRYQVTAPAK